MRLTKIEKMAITSVIKTHDKDAEIYLFGSRTDDTKRGGDIDLLVLSESLSLSTKLDILVEIKKLIGEQKIDLIIKSKEQSSKDLFIQSLVLKLL